MKLNILTAAIVLIPLCLATPLSAQTKELLPTSTQNALSTSTSSWYRYTATDGSYSALFPGQPEESVEPDSSVQVMYEDRATMHSTIHNPIYLMGFTKVWNF